AVRVRDPDSAARVGPGASEALPRLIPGGRTQGARAALPDRAGNLWPRGPVRPECCGGFYQAVRDGGSDRGRSPGQTLQHGPGQPLAARRKEADIVTPATSSFAYSGVPGGRGRPGKGGPGRGPRATLTPLPFIQP